MEPAEVTAVYLTLSLLTDLGITLDVTWTEGSQIYPFDTWVVCRAEERRLGDSCPRIHSFPPAVGRILV